MVPCTVTLPYVRDKYGSLLECKDSMDFDIYWDGACSADKIMEYAPLGVKGFVIGTTLLFGVDISYADTIAAIKRMEFEGKL